jgi:long-chain acyl-CoA synthetase
MTTTLIAALIELAADPSATPAVIEKRFGKWVERSQADIGGDAAATAGGLRSLGVGRGDVVGLMSTARLAWITTDLGIQATGASTVAVPATAGASAAAQMLREAGARWVVVEGQDEADTVLSAVEAGELDQLEHIIYIDAAGVAEYTSSLLRALDEVKEAGEGTDLAGLARDLDPAGAAAMVPTAGLGALVAVSHATLVQSARSTIAAFSLSPKDRTVALRDIADPVERGATIYASLLSGALLGLPENAATADSAVYEIAPTYLHVTQRWLTQNAARITVRFDENRGLKARLAGSWRRRTGGSLDRYGSAKRPRGLWRFIVTIPVLEKLGLEKARAVVESGDTAPRQLLGFYQALGLPVRSALGLPQLAGFASVGEPAAVDGWVGSAVPGVTLTDESGSLVVSTEATGSFDTGVPAEAVDGGFVADIGSPERAAETRLRSVPVVSSALVGPGGSSVIVELDGPIASRWAARNHLDAATYRSFSLLPEMKDGVTAVVTAILERFDLTPGEVHILHTPLHDVSGALGFGDAPQRNLIAELV